MRGSRRWRAGRLLVIALLLLSVAGCSIYSGTKPQKVRQWVNRSAFLADINTVLSDVSNIHQAMETGTVKELRTICAGLADDVGTVYESLPTPDPNLTDGINVPVQLMFTASNSCSQASSVTSSAAERAYAQLERGESELKQVQSRLETFGVHWKARL